jgi:hypothetical protein
MTKIEIIISLILVAIGGLMMSVGVQRKPDMVGSITINRRTITIVGKKYPKNAHDVISYHRFARR